MKPLNLLICITAATLAAGCSPQLANPLVSLPASPRENVPDADIQLATYRAADIMLASLKQYLDRYDPIAAASFVDLNDMNRTAPIGRLLSRHLASRFTQLGFSMVEVKLRNEMLIKEGAGEMMLSRDLKEIRQEWKAQAVIVGNYTAAKDTLFVSAQLVRTEDGVTLASYDFHLPMGPNTRALLRTPYKG